MPRLSLPRLLLLEVCDQKVIGATFSGQALYSCALVCRDSVPEITDTPLQDVQLYNSRAVVAVTASPEFGRYVIDFTVELHHKPASWIYYFVQVVPLLLPNLDHLEWHSLPVFQTLFHVLSSRFSTISSLALHDLKNQSFAEILRLVNRCHRLRSLRIHDCEWRSPSSFYPRRYCKLRSFYLDFATPECDSDVLRWLTISKSASALDSLHLVDCQIPFHSQYLDNLLQQCEATLQKHELGIDVFLPAYLKALQMNRVWSVSALIPY